MAQNGTKSSLQNQGGPLLLDGSPLIRSASHPPKLRKLIFQRRETPDPNPVLPPVSPKLPHPMDHDLPVSGVGQGRRGPGRERVIATSAGGCREMAPGVRGGVWALREGLWGRRGVAL